MLRIDPRLISDRAGTARERFDAMRVHEIRTCSIYLNKRMLKPSDLALLLLIAAYEDERENWHQRRLAAALQLSLGGINQALQRLARALLYDAHFRRVQCAHLREVLQTGLRFIYPTHPGEIAHGLPTAASASPLKEALGPGTQAYVWPHEQGDLQGLAVAPLTPGVVHAAPQHPRFHEYMALVDALRVGRARERAKAQAILADRLS